MISIELPKPKLFLLPVLCVLVQFSATSVAAQTNNSFTVENYYKVKWGYADEFISLWSRNHYPLLKEAKKNGTILSVTAHKPKLHSSEETRWDFRVTIVFKNSTYAFDPDLTTPFKKLLYPDLDKLARDEQHRFELLIAHWDVMTENVDLQ